MAHQAKALVLTCMDFRFQKLIRNFLVEGGYDEKYDHVSLAGAAKNLVEEPTQTLILNQIKLSCELHHSEEIILINHQDCGAYKEKLAQNPDKDEFAVHRADLIASKALILSALPQVTVKLVYLTLAQEFKEVGD